jgi:prophage DNA circulation protein
MPILLKDDANYPIPQLVKADGSFVAARGTDNGEALVYDSQLKSVQDNIKAAVTTMLSDVSIVKTDVGTIKNSVTSLANTINSIDTRTVTLVSNSNDIKSLLNTISSNVDGLDGLLGQLVSKVNEIEAKLQEHKSEQVTLALSVGLTDTTATYALPSGYASGYAVLYINVEALSSGGTVRMEVIDNTAFNGCTVLAKEYSAVELNREKVEVDTDNMAVKVSVSGTATVSVIAYLKV